MIDLLIVQGYKVGCSSRADFSWFDYRLFHMRIIFHYSPGLFVKNLMGEPEDEGNNGRDKVDHAKQVIFEEFQPAFPRRIPMTSLLQYELRPEPEHHPAPFLNAH